MRLRTLALLGVAGWVYSQGPRDPREWGAYLAEQAVILKEQGREALEAGKRANARRRAQIEREIAEAMGGAPPA